VSVDAHGVLLLPNPETIRTILSEFRAQPNDEECWIAHFQMVQLLDQVLPPDWPTMNRSFPRVLRVPSHLQDETGTILANEIYLGMSWIPAPGVAEALARLTENKIPAMVVSNTSHGKLAELLAKVELGTDVDGANRSAAIIDSHVIGVEKPDPQPFRLALDALQSDASECVHVGDSLHSDIVGAIGVGMKAARINPLVRCHTRDHWHAPSFAAFVTRLLEMSDINLQ
jgi:putative hydrolase of the HAD superfamily